MTGPATPPNQVSVDADTILGVANTLSQMMGTYRYPADLDQWVQLPATSAESSALRDALGGAAGQLSYLVPYARGVMMQATTVAEKLATTVPDLDNHHATRIQADTVINQAYSTTRVAKPATQH